MKKILGLDLGVSSIGWALISEEGNNKTILGMGSRIIPLSVDDKNEFSGGNAISKNQQRTVKRTIRKGYDRYQMRKKYLREILSKLEMMPDAALFNLSALELYSLRDKAVKQKITLPQLGRILFHLNQKRGYKSSRLDNTEDKKETEYVQTVLDRFQNIKDLNITVGQYFFNGLQTTEHYRIKEQVFPREAYLEEFDLIWETQSKFYPNILNEANKEEIRNKIIYFQRKLKSQKGLISVCEFEGAYYKKDGKDIFGGPRVTPRSSPLFQLCKIWESINNIQIKDISGNKFEISLEQKQALFEYLDENDRLTESALYKILGISKADGYYGNQMTEKGIQGNLTKSAFLKIFKSYKNLISNLNFNLKEEEYQNIDKNTGEVGMRIRISAEFENQPLYQLWHLVYSVKDSDDLATLLRTKYNLQEDVITEILKIDFVKSGFGNKSSRAIRKILPYLQRGNGYADACAIAGYNHSNSLTKSENISRKLLDKLPLLKKNSLRQPIVETILNQMINIVNAVGDNYGKPDEIRVELARELKQSREERNKATTNINKREKENKNIEIKLNELGLSSKKRNIEKYRLYLEINNDESKLNATCIYCNQLLSFTSSINGTDVEVEHIIPRSRLFDDSFQNKTLAHTKCNAEKGNRTAFDFMKSKSEKEFNAYLDRVEMLFKNKIISKAKRDKFLTAADDIPTDFIARQLRETQYVAKKAREILMQACHHVHATSGGVTDYLRHQWGWNDVLMNLQLEKYRSVGLTEFIDVSENDIIKKKEVIKNWSKRNDHRHHAIDALTVSCTSQGIIQRLNNLNKYVQVNEGETKRGVLMAEETLKSFVQNQKPFTTKEVEDAADKILVSFKPGKKVATHGRRLIKKGGKKIVAQKYILVPRGPLSEESIYGKIKIIERNVPLKKLFERPESILKRYIRVKVQERLKQFDNDPKKAFNSTRKEPIFLDKDNTVILDYASVYNEEFVIKYKIDTNLNANKVDKIVDDQVRKIVKERLDQFNGKEKEAFKDLTSNPIWLNKEKGIQVKTVRCKTGLSNLQPLHYSANGITGAQNDFNSALSGVKETDYVKPGNNHHVSIFIDENGKLYDIVTTFWEAVERKKEGLPIINSTHPLGYTFLFSMQQNEMFLYNADKSENELEQLNIEQVSQRLYRVQKISKKSAGDLDVWFRHHLESELIDTLEAKNSLRYINIRSTQKLISFIKIKIDNLGNIVRR